MGHFAALTLGFAVMAGCAGPVGVAVHVAPDEADAPACDVDVTAPEQYADVLRRNDVRGVDCHVSRWAGTFEFGFAHAGWTLHVAVPLASPEVVDLTAGDVGVFFQGDGWCNDWRGTLRWRRAPDWLVSLDALCVADPAIAVIGAWSGHD